MRKGLEKAADKKLRTLLKDTDPDKDPRRCTGQSFVYDKKGPGQVKLFDKDTGLPLRKPCEKFAIKGGFVCTTHGGSAKQVRAAATERLLSMVDDKITRLDELAEQNTHLPTAFNATKEILKAAKVVEDSSGKSDGTGNKPTVLIGINFGGLATGKDGAVMLSPGAIEAKIVDGEKT